MNANGRTRVLVCEDSRTYAAALTRLLEHGGEIEVVGVCATAEEAIAALARLEPDLVTMDVELPGMSGLEAVEHIMSTSPLPILVLSAHVGARSDTAAAALAAGALDALSKDTLDMREPESAAATAFRSRVRLLSRARVIRHPRANLRRPPPAGARGSQAPAVVGIAASTGGPVALAVVLEGLPASFPIPILVVQHMAAGFTEGLVRWLDRALPVSVRLARDGEALARGVRVAPDGAHLRLAGRTLTLDRTTVAGPHRPSADVLLASLAESAREHAVGVVLTGMGRDGAEGLRAIHDAGGVAIAQDEESSAVYGMPKAAAERTPALVLPLDEIAGKLASLATRARGA